MFPIILHLDMNSYFASVEQQDSPAYRGKPVGVCEHLGGIIIAASIEAKRWGIKTGTAVWEARKLYPKIILTRTHPERYRLYASRLHKVVGDYTDKVEVYSIDEVFLDITKACNIRVPIKDLGLMSENLNLKSEICNLVPVDPYEEAVRIARTIKRRMKREVGDYLTCSVGIGPNKLVAKIASDMQKPDGMVVVRGSQSVIRNPSRSSDGTARRMTVPQSGSNASDVRDGYIELVKEDLYQRLKLTDIPGIGVRQEKRLNELGIRTLSDLREYKKSWLVSKFGILGHHLHSMGQLEGSWKEHVADEEGIKSMGHMYTLPEEYRERKYFVPVLYRLCEMVGRRLRLQGLWGNILHFHLHDKDHECYGQSKKLGYNIQDGREMFLECMAIFDRVGNGLKPFPTGHIRLVGVTVAGLSEAVNQLSLFGDAERTRRIDQALDKLDEKYGDFTVCRAPVLAARNAIHDSIGFGRLRERNKWKEEG